jgi:hypothetical protein
MTMGQLQLKEINGYKGYFIDTDGNVWTTKKHKGKSELTKLKLSKKKTGYLYANIYWGNHNNERSSLRVNRLVYQTFVSCIPEGFVIDHINDIKDDNRLENLQMLSVAQNTQKYWNTPHGQNRKKQK